MPRLSFALAVAATALALPTTAQAAATVGPGPDVLLSDADQLTCDAGCTLAQARYANEDAVVPSFPGTDRGVVVGYRIRGHGGEVRLRRLAVNGTSATGGAATAWEDLPAGDGARGYAVRVPVKAGDALAVDITGGAQVGYFADESDFGDQLLGWEPALGAGQSKPADADITGYFGFSAQVEPDADGDGLGDETQDACVNCHPAPSPSPTPADPGPGDPGPAPSPAPGDPYAAIRKSGPKITLAPTGSAAKRTVSVTATNPYAFPLKGRLVLEQGRRKVAKAMVKLPASATKTVRLKVSKALARKLARARKARLTAAATLSGPVGRARTTRRKLTLAKPAKGGGKGIDGTYVGSGATAGWTMVIRNGVVENFNGRASLYCTKAHQQEFETFAMVGDDPDPLVAPDGSFAWEATSGYGFLKLKFRGTVSGGVARGNLVLEDRPPIQGADPVTGMPRIEFEYCFVGQDYELRRK